MNHKKQEAAAQKGFTDGAEYMMNVFNDELIKALHATVAECARICRANGHEQSAKEIEQLVEPMQ